MDKITKEYKIGLYNESELNTLAADGWSIEFCSDLQDFSVKVLLSRQKCDTIQAVRMSSVGLPFDMDDDEFSEVKLMEPRDEIEKIIKEVEELVPV